jgi:hypothetical protein
MARKAKPGRNSQTYVQYANQVLRGHGGQCSSKELAQGVAKFIGLNPKYSLGPSQIKGLSEALKSAKGKIQKFRDGKSIVYAFVERQVSSKNGAAKPKRGKNEIARVVGAIEKVPAGMTVKRLEKEDEPFTAVVLALRRMVEYIVSCNGSGANAYLANRLQIEFETHKVRLKEIEEIVSRHEILYQAMADVNQQIATQSVEG